MHVSCCTFVLLLKMHFSVGECTVFLQESVCTSFCRKTHIFSRKKKYSGGSRIMSGSHVCRTKLARKIFFRGTNVLTKVLRNFPEILEPLFCGSEKIPQNFPPKSQTRFTDELLRERRENNLLQWIFLFLRNCPQLVLRWRQFYYLFLGPRRTILGSSHARLFISLFVRNFRRVCSQCCLTAFYKFLNSRGNPSLCCFGRGG